MTLKNRKQAERPPKFCDFGNIERGKSHQIIGIHLIYIMRESPIIRHLRSLKARLSLKNECVWLLCVPVRVTGASVWCAFPASPCMGRTSGVHIVRTCATGSLFPFKLRDPLLELSYFFRLLSNYINKFTIAFYNNTILINWS